MKDKLFDLLFPLIFVGILVVGIGGTVYMTVVPHNISHNDAIKIAKTKFTESTDISESTAFAFHEKTNAKAINFDGSFVTFKQAKELKKTHSNKVYQLDDYWIVYLAPNNLSYDSYVYVYQIDAKTKKITDSTQISMQKFRPNVTVSFN